MEPICNWASTSNLLKLYITNFWPDASFTPYHVTSPKWGIFCRLSVFLNLIYFQYISLLLTWRFRMVPVLFMFLRCHEIYLSFLWQRRKGRNSNVDHRHQRYARGIVFIFLRLWNMRPIFRLSSVPKSGADCGRRRWLLCPRMSLQSDPYQSEGWVEAPGNHFVKLKCYIYEKVLTLIFILIFYTNTTYIFTCILVQYLVNI